jgi:hypothetical protein
MCSYSPNGAQQALVSHNSYANYLSLNTFVILEKKAETINE